MNNKEYTIKFIVWLIFHCACILLDNFLKFIFLSYIHRMIYFVLQFYVNWIQLTCYLSESNVDLLGRELVVGMYRKII